MVIWTINEVMFFLEVDPDKKQILQSPNVPKRKR